MSYMMSKSQYLDDDSPHWHPHLMFYMPGEMNASVWGANLPAGSAVFGGGEDLPGGGRMPWTLFFVPVPSLVRRHASGGARRLMNDGANPCIAARTAYADTHCSACR